MANHASAEKRARRNIKRRMINRARKSEIRTAIKRVLTAVDTGNADAASVALKNAVSLIDRAGQKGVIHPNQASRRVLRLTAKVNPRSDIDMRRMPQPFDSPGIPKNHSSPTR